MVGRPAMSKSLFVNEAIIHYHDKECGQMRRNIAALQDRLLEMGNENEELKARVTIWSKLARTLNLLSRRRHR